MRWTPHRKPEDCAVCSVSMASDLPYDFVETAIENFKPKTQLGAYVSQIKKCMSFLGIFDTLKEGKSFNTIPLYLKGRKSIVIVYCEDKTHAIFWNGFYFMDSTIPDKLISFDIYARHTEEFFFLPIKTSISARISSIIFNVLDIVITKTYWPSKIHKIKQNVKNLD